ncbi:MAG: acetate kinase [Opitutales bacterium]|nr:acetate kinase [Opitutales bacterium]
MGRNTLVINCGSSSLKFAVYNEEESCFVKGVVERLGAEDPVLKWEKEGEKQTCELTSGADHEIALRKVSEIALSGEQIHAVGHRVVHGAERFKSTAVITDEMLQQVEACNHLAPLHNPANLIGIRVAKQVFGDLPQVGVFDTAFHQTLAKEVFLYPIPYELYEELGVRRYGFHGTSHHYIYQELANKLSKPLEQTSMICAHLGNGCSAAAAEQGESRDTTMGLTPLEGLVMGTRCGDIDPSLHGFLCREKGWTIEEVEVVLNKKSGLQGISGVSNDMRELVQASNEGNDRAKLALDIFTFRLAKSISALRVSITNCDAIVFTGGIGEHNPWLRKKVIDRLGYLGCKIDGAANDSNGKNTNGRISDDHSTVSVWVIPTDEELMIARQTMQTISDS